MNAIQKLLFIAVSLLVLALAYLNAQLTARCDAAEKRLEEAEQEIDFLINRLEDHRINWK